MRFKQSRYFCSRSRTDSGLNIELTPDMPGRNRIFNHGFATRKEGHGFGLHSGALVAGEMGGTMRVHSDGPGRGATLTLELPLRSQSGSVPENLTAHCEP